MIDLSGKGSLTFNSSELDQLKTNGAIQQQPNQAERAVSDNPDFGTCKHEGFLSRFYSIVKQADSTLAYYVTGKHLLRSSESEDDRRVIGVLNNFIDRKTQTVPQYFEKEFGDKHAKVFERNAAHSYWIRVFIEKEGVPKETQELISGLSQDQTKLAFAYLKCLDMGGGCVKSKYPEYYKRVQPYSQDFMASMDKKEKAFYEKTEEPLPSYFKDGGKLRPKSTTTLTHLSPKISHHPVTSLMLGEFRRAVEPDQQLQIDAHFHKANMASRPRLLKEMFEKGGSVENIDGVLVTNFSKGVQIEFYPDRKKTDVLSYLNSSQGEGALTTQGEITQFEMQDKHVYLIKYHNYKTNQTCYLVSYSIPIGMQGEEYCAEMDFDSAMSMVKEKLRK